MSSAIEVWRQHSKWIVVATLAVALVVLGVLESWPLKTPEDWTAAAAWLTAAVAVAAGVAAVGQLGEARRFRIEQAQPYVVAYMEPSGAGPFFVDLVVRNFGTTAAHDVGVTIDPAPRRRAGEGGDVVLPESIPVLVPGQEWRTFWDSGERLKSDLPDRHEACVRFKDSQGRSLSPIISILDWEAHKDQLMIGVFGMHHAAEALRKIEKTTAGWKESGGGGLAVTVRDGDAKDARLREQRAEQRAPREQPPEGEQ